MYNCVDRCVHSGCVGLRVYVQVKTSKIFISKYLYQTHDVLLAKSLIPLLPKQADLIRLLSFVRDFTFCHIRALFTIKEKKRKK